MNILLIGSGGREHALAWKLAQSPRLTRLWAAPGNPGIGEHGALVALDVKDHGAVLAFCHAHSVDLVVIGPEAPLVDGLGDSLRGAGFAVFGPSAAAARLEGSKGFTKDLCARAGIPTAGYVRAASLQEACAALDRFSAPYVLKADGLAAGKGVVLPDSRGEAEAALRSMFADPGAEVVIEEFMTGEEVSVFALTDGETIVPFGSAQDHKRVGDGDTGPNTGGMGAYSPATVLTPELEACIMREIIAPTVQALRAAGTPYSGVLYAGVMLTGQGPRLVEYNARFGDPECQVLMMRFEGDLAALLLACAEGKLAAAPPPVFSPQAALTVVVAAKGYPGTPAAGGAIHIPAFEDPRVKLFQAGTRLEDGRLVASGGRVLNATALGASVIEAQQNAYRAAEAIDFADGFYRRDIGWREVAREQERERGRR
jgi:phosphoribosylamine---glycine ligase